MNRLYALAGISKQAHHKYMKRQSDQSIKLSQLVLEADQLRARHPGCGVEKMYDTLRPPWLGRDKFISIFMALGYRVKKVKNYARTTVPGYFYYSNLIKGLCIYSKNQVWQTDITYYRVVDRFYYICFIIDVYTREIIGYRVSSDLRAESNCIALQMAFRANEGHLEGLIHHSDRGSQYISGQYTQMLLEQGIYISMGEKAQDNAYAERVNGIIKNEYLAYKFIESEKQLRAEVKKAVVHYNNQRIHSSLPNKQTPSEFAANSLPLSDPKRPMVIIYTEGYKIKEASSPLDFRPLKGPPVHICPMAF